MPEDESRPRNEVAAAPSAPPPDFYVEGDLLVYTAAHHLKRGTCCGSGCRHCPYEPRHVAGTTRVRE